MLVAAVAAELGPLPGEALGVGPIRAACTLSRLLATRRPSAVLLLGSCGAYDPAHPLGVARVSRRLGWADGAATAGLAYVPAPPPVLEANLGLRAALGLDCADVLTLASICADAALAGRLAATDGPWALEHMEAYGAALACAEAGVPFAAVLGVANHVGPGAHAQWLAHRGAAEAAARAAIAAFLAHAGEAAGAADPV